MNKHGKKTEKDTICWECQNYSRCSWTDGIPVKGWKAQPTLIINKNFCGDRTRVTKSFIVEDCPKFKPDKKRRVLFADIAEIIGKSKRYAYVIKKRKGIGRIKDLLKEKGYILHVHKGKGKNFYFLQKINDT